MERTLIIIKPDGVQRGLMGEILSRFEKKGLKVIGMKFMRLDDALLREHYAHVVDRPFFAEMEQFMKSSPVAVAVIEGHKVVELVRLMAGTKSTEMGTIRGEFGLAFKGEGPGDPPGFYNVIHSSETKEEANEEIKRFFADSELFCYSKDEWRHIYGEGCL